MSAKALLIIIAAAVLLGAGSWLGYSMAKNVGNTDAGSNDTPTTTTGESADPGGQPVAPAPAPERRATGETRRQAQPRAQNPSRAQNPVRDQPRPVILPVLTSEQQAEAERFTESARERFGGTEWNVGGEALRFEKDGSVSIGGEPTGEWKPADGQLHYSLGAERHSIQVFEGALVSEDGTPLEEVGSPGQESPKKVDAEEPSKK